MPIITQYLSANPSTVCWEGKHAGDAALACFGVVVYYVMIPIAYYRVLLVYIPAVGRANKWATAYFGFLYTRFMPELWFWEIVELGRKVRGPRRAFGRPAAPRDRQSCHRCPARAVVPILSRWCLHRPFDCVYPRLPTAVVPRARWR